jgi:hypothetical protein
MVVRNGGEGCGRGVVVVVKDLLGNLAKVRRWERGLYGRR